MAAIILIELINELIFSLSIGFLKSLGRSRAALKSNTAHFVRELLLVQG